MLLTPSLPVFLFYVDLCPPMSQALLHRVLKIQSQQECSLPLVGLESRRKVWSAKEIVSELQDWWGELGHPVLSWETEVNRQGIRDGAYVTFQISNGWVFKKYLNPANPVGKSLVPAVGNKVLDINKTCYESLSANSPLGSLHTHEIAQRVASIVSCNLPNALERPIRLFLYFANQRTEAQNR